MKLKIIDINENSIHVYFQQCLMKSKEKFPKFDISKVFLSTKLKGKSLGRCTYHKNNETFTIKINMWYVENYPNTLENTIFHEIAHAIERQLYNNMSHSYRWKSIMIKLGYSPERCADNIEKSDTRIYHFVYKCKCQEHYLSKTRHNKLKKNPNIYICNRCKSKLTFEKEI